MQWVGRSQQFPWHLYPQCVMPGAGSKCTSILWDSKTNLRHGTGVQVRLSLDSPTFYEIVTPELEVPETWNLRHLTLIL